MVGRAALVALAIVASAGAAAAQRARKVVIDTIPTGATIYIDSKDDGPRGESPLELELAPGTYTVIAERDTYDPEFAELSVPKAGKKPVELTVRLQVAMARMRVEGAPAGATVKIDELKALPIEEYEDGFDVPAGAHTVLVELNGKTIAEEFITVESGQEEVVTVRAAFKGGRRGGDGDGDGTSSVTTTVDDGPPRKGPIITVGPLFEFTWRRFTYQGDNDTPMQNLQMGQYGPLVGLSLELHPFRATGVRALHPFAIVASGGRGFSQPVVADDAVTFQDVDSLTTFWWRFDVGVRYRIGLGRASIDLEGGYAGQYFRFNGNIDDVARLPDAAYQTVRFGGRLGVRAGAVTIYAGGENRIVLSGGELEARYTDASQGTNPSADTSGFGVRGGLEAALWQGKLAARLEGQFARFSWAFDGYDAGAMYQAEGGTDTVYGVGMVVGYAY